MNSASEVFIFFTEPLVPYHVTVVAVNLAGPGEQETMNFFTSEGGVCINYASCVLLLLNMYNTPIQMQG